MNWDAVGAIAELLGAVGVIISLAYLSVQIRQNTRQIGEHSRELRISAIDSIANSFSRFRDPLIRDPEIAALWVRGIENYREGATTEAAWQDHRQAIAANLHHPGVRTWWAETRPIYADEFELVIEELPRETPAEPDTPDRPIATEQTP